MRVTLMTIVVAMLPFTIGQEIEAGNLTERAGGYGGRTKWPKAWLYTRESRARRGLGSCKIVN